jgi:hypothetical protein
MATANSLNIAFRTLCNYYHVTSFRVASDLSAFAYHVTPFRVASDLSAFITATLYHCAKQLRTVQRSTDCYCKARQPPISTTSPSATPAAFRRNGEVRTLALYSFFFKNLFVHLFAADYNDFAVDDAGCVEAE